MPLRLPARLVFVACPVCVKFLSPAVCSDTLTHEMKGDTVMNDVERYEAIRHCRYVDEILPEAPWQLDDEFIERNKVVTIRGWWALSRELASSSGDWEFFRKFLAKILTSC